jgi:hypothetical protein
MGQASDAMCDNLEAQMGQHGSHLGMAYVYSCKKLSFILIIKKRIASLTTPIGEVCQCHGYTEAPRQDCSSPFRQINASETGRLQRSFLRQTCYVLQLCVVELSADLDGTGGASA